MVEILIEVIMFWIIGTILSLYIHEFGHFVAAERLAEILDLELEKVQDEKKTLALDSLNLPIRIENLDFGYGTRRLVLENINMTINAGEKIALVGESGSGKTTLSKLLMNFYPYSRLTMNLKPLKVTGTVWNSRLRMLMI